MTTPTVSDCTWRPLEHGDAPGLQELLAACAAADGNPAPTNAEEAWARLTKTAPLRASLAAIDGAGQLAACSWVSIDDSLRHERRAFLAVFVAPACRGRGLGSFLFT